MISAVFWAIVTVCLVDARVTRRTSDAGSISPDFAFIGDTTVFSITNSGIQPPVLCVTSFNGSEQAGAASYDVDEIRCTIIAPELLATNGPLLLNATLFLMRADSTETDNAGALDTDAANGTSNDETGREDLVSRDVFGSFDIVFVQRPVIQGFLPLTVVATPSATVQVQLVGFEGLLQLEGELEGLLRIQPGANAYSTPVECRSIITPLSETLTFALPSKASELSSGRYIVDVLIGRPDPTAPHFALHQPSPGPLFLDIEQLLVSLAKPFTDLSTVAADAAGQASPSTDPTASSAASLSVALDHTPTTPVSATLRLVWSSKSNLLLPSTVLTPDKLIVASDVPVGLPLPSSESGATVLNVTWNPESPLRQTFSLQDRGGSHLAATLVLQIVAVNGGTADGHNVATEVLLKGSSASDSAPTGTVSGVSTAFRGDKALEISVALQRNGSNSRAAMVQWTLTYIDEPSSVAPPSAFAGDPMLSMSQLESLVFPDGTSGVIAWDAGASGAQTVRVPITWDVVPYDVRWRLKLQLSRLVNVQAGEDPGNATAAVIYGTPEGMCPPGAARSFMLSSPTLPVPKDIQTKGGTAAAARRSPSIKALLLSSDMPQPRYLSPEPEFRANVTSYSAVVEFNATDTKVVVVADREMPVVITGCGFAAQFALSDWKTVDNDTSSLPGVYSLHILTVALPVDSPNSMPCNLTIAACAASDATDISVCKPSSLLSYTMALTRLSDPRYSTLASVQLVVDGTRSVVCADSSVLREAKRRRQGQPAASGFPPDAEPTVALINLPFATLYPPVCDPSAPPVATVSGVGGKVLTVAAAPMYAHVPDTQVSIGQRMFSTGPSVLDSAFEVGVAILDNKIDTPERWLPFTVDTTTHPATPVDLVMDVPITLALADGRTASQQLVKIGLQWAGVPAVSVEKVPVEQQWQDDSDTFVWPNDPLKSGDCAQCKLGFYAYSVDAAVCLRCPPGSVAPQHGMASCLPCPAGSYTPIYGSSFCSPCLWGFYAPFNSSSGCQLCPPGFTTSSEGSAACDISILGPSAPGSGYSLIVNLAVVLVGASLDEIPARVGVVGALGIDVLGVLIKSDASAAFKIPESNVNLLSVNEPALRTLKVELSAQIDVNIPPGASDEEIAAAIAIAQLSKDNGVASLSWGRTTQALGVEAETLEDETTTEVRGPKGKHSLRWAEILFPVLAGVIILSTILTLWRRTSLCGTLCGSCGGGGWPPGGGRAAGWGGHPFQVLASGASMLFSNGLRSGSSSSGVDLSRCSIEMACEREITTRKRTALDENTPRHEEA